jgi:hypothetical protein
VSKHAAYAKRSLSRRNFQHAFTGLCTGSESPLSPAVHAPSLIIFNQREEQCTCTAQYSNHTHSHLHVEEHDISTSTTRSKFGRFRQMIWQRDTARGVARLTAIGGQAVPNSNLGEKHAYSPSGLPPVPCFNPHRVRPVPSSSTRLLAC